jgi:porin
MNNFRKPGAPRKARRGAVGRAPAWTRLGSAAVLASLFCLAAPPAASAEDTPSAATTKPGSQPATKPDDSQPNASETTGSDDLDFSPSGLLSAFHQERQKLKDLGITFKVHEESEVWANLTGGGKQGVSYDGLTIGKLDFDLEKLFGWSGAEFLVEAFDIHAHGPSRNFVGNLQLVSNIEATPSVKLYDLWLDQSLLDNKLSVRFGQEGANDEMMTSTYGGLFLNSSFGFPGMPAADLPSGGPNYPLATPFARAWFKATDNVTLVGAVFNGDPAPPGTGDPQARDRNGTAFRLNDHTLGFAEVWYQPEQDLSSSLPTTYKLGGWYSSDNFADQRFDATGGLLANPASTGMAQQHTGDWAFYGIVDQMVWQRSGTKDQGIGVFLQVMGGPSDRNLSNLFIEGGMNWRAPFTDSGDDILGLAVSYLGISPAAQNFGRDLVTFGRASAPYASNETVLEATYQTPVTDWLTLQPDAQYVLNPGAGIVGPFGNRPLPNALVIGLRATFRL